MFLKRSQTGGFSVGGALVDIECAILFAYVKERFAVRRPYGIEIVAVEVGQFRKLIAAYHPYI